MLYTAILLYNIILLYILEAEVVHESDLDLTGKAVCKSVCVCVCVRACNHSPYRSSWQKWKIRRGHSEISSRLLPLRPLLSQVDIQCTIMYIRGITV